MNLCLTKPCPSCIQTRGFETNCTIKPSGGNDTYIYIISKCQVEGFEDDYTIPCIKTGVTLQQDAVFYTIIAQTDTVSLVQDLPSQDASITQTLTFNTSPLSDAPTKEESACDAIAFVNELGNSRGLVALVKGRDGVIRILGYENGLDSVAINYNSGAAKSDIPIYAITLTGVEPEFAPILSCDADVPVYGE